VRFEGVPGEFSQHDFGQGEGRYLDGTEERIHFFASRLKYSRWVDGRLVEDERIEALVRSLLAGFASFGGIVWVAVFDNPTTVTLGGRAAASGGTRRSARWRSTTASAWSGVPRDAGRRRGRSRTWWASSKGASSRCAVFTTTPIWLLSLPPGITR
jgi:hypothetical protein